MYTHTHTHRAILYLSMPLIMRVFHADQTRFMINNVCCFTWKDLSINIVSYLSKSIRSVARIHTQTHSRTHFNSSYANARTETKALIFVPPSKPTEHRTSIRVLLAPYCPLYAHWRHHGHVVSRLHSGAGIT